MPLVRITLRKGQTPEFLRAMSNAVHDALVATANVPADDRFHVIEEVEHDRLVAHPTYGGVERSENVVFVQITLNAGRTVDVKRALYADLARRLQESIDVRPDDVLVSLVEVTRENWSFGGGRATYA
ncbi:MAG TPA: tautomerase family protein [Thermoanaerobaculia bacterium]|jgi:phenylpyruvate tautomerase PptA (4-oxalocrotonate tautomerase family)